MKKQEFIEKYGKEAYNKMQLQVKEWRKKNKERLNDLQNTYRKTKYGRALHMVSVYRAFDKKRKKGECTLTPEQLVELWENGCYWCGESDWQKLGADRIDNTKPHTIENCVCCCSDCNNERRRKTFEDFTKLKKVG